MRTLAFLLPLLLAHCTGFMHEAHTVGGNYERDILLKIGGTASQRGADGSSIVVDDQDSFRSAAALAAGGIAAHYNNATNTSNNSVKLGNQKPTVTTDKLPDGSFSQTANYPPPQ